MADALASGDGSSAGNSTRKAALEELAKRCCQQAAACGISPIPAQCAEIVDKKAGKSIDDVIADFAVDIIAKDVSPQTTLLE